jgi:hypothetical protein
VHLFIFNQAKRKSASSSLRVGLRGPPNTSLPFSVHFFATKLVELRVEVTLRRKVWHRANDRSEILRAESVVPQHGCLSTPESEIADAIPRKRANRLTRLAENGFPL